METRLFNLLHERWILVSMGDGREEELSLMEVFQNAHLIKGLAGELEAQNVALLRLLLAILYAVFARQAADGKPDPIASYGDAEVRWRILWEMRRFPSEVIKEYLQHYEDRFWLVHPTRPFYQVPLGEEPVTIEPGFILMPTIKPVVSLIGDISESENKGRHFKARFIEKGIDFREAARWLVYLNSFDAAPAGAPGRRETGLRIRGYGTAWLSKLGVVWASGSNLFETLMLNLVLYSIADDSIRWATCTPEWERTERFTPSVLLETEQPFPSDLCALYTMQFRRVQLLSDKDDGLVTGYLLWSGQSLDPLNALMEPMTAWRKTDEGFVPKLHDPSRQMWRDYSALLPASGNAEFVPGIVKWLSRLKNRSALSLPLIRLNTAGITYTNNTAVDQVFSDALNVNAGMLTELGQSWHSRISTTLTDTNKLASRLVGLERSLRKASGGDDSPKKLMKAVEYAFFALDEPFRSWLESIRTEEDDMDVKCAEWLDTAKRVIRAVGKRMVYDAGPSALSGRILKEDIAAESSMQRQVMNNIETGFEIRRPRTGAQKREKRYTAAEAYNDFLQKTT